MPSTDSAGCKPGIEKMNYQKLVTDILDSAKKLTSEKERVGDIFQASGIKVDRNLAFIDFNDSPETCIRALMDKLSAMPVLKISAKRILRNEGVNL